VLVEVDVLLAVGRVVLVGGARAGGRLRRIGLLAHPAGAHHVVLHVLHVGLGVVLLLALAEPAEHLVYPLVAELAAQPLQRFGREGADADRRRLAGRFQLAGGEVVLVLAVAEDEGSLAASADTCTRSSRRFRRRAASSTPPTGRPRARVVEQRGLLLLGRVDLPVAGAGGGAGGVPERIRLADPLRADRGLAHVLCDEVLVELLRERVVGPVTRSCAATSGANASKRNGASARRLSMVSACGEIKRNWLQITGSAQPMATTEPEES
jgi:hypothetical protein